MLETALRGSRWLRPLIAAAMMFCVLKTIVSSTHELVKSVVPVVRRTTEEISKSYLSQQADLRTLAWPWFGSK